MTISFPTVFKRGMPVRQATPFRIFIRRSRVHWAGALVAAGLLLAWPHLLTLEPAPPDTSDIGCPVASLLLRHRDNILNAAATHGIPGTAIAGVIAAEWTLNRSFVDTAQERWLSLRLQRHDDAWWAQWAEQGAQAAAQARAAQPGRSNPWPLSLIASGYVMSFGLAQLKPRTVILACQRFAAEEPVCWQGIKELMASLLSEEDSIRLAAAVLRQEANIWRTHTDLDATTDASLLATFYSAGAEARLAQRDEASRTWLNRFAAGSPITSRRSTRCSPNGPWVWLNARDKAPCLRRKPPDRLELSVNVERSFPVEGNGTTAVVPGVRAGAGRADMAVATGTGSGGSPSCRATHGGQVGGR